MLLQIVYLVSSLVVLIGCALGAREAITNHKDIDLLEGSIIWTILIAGAVSGGYTLLGVLHAIGAL